MIQVLYHPAVAKDLKKLEKSTQQLVVDEIVSSLATNPRSGVPLSGIFRGFLKFAFHHKGVSYRLVYQPKHNGQVLIVAVAPRGEVYKILTRRLR